MEDDKIIEKDLSILAKSSIFVFVAVILSKVFMYLYRIIIARYYGPEVYGLFSLAFVIFNFFMVFASLGLFEGLIRFIPIYREDKNKIRYLIKFSKNILFYSSVFAGVLLFFSSEIISTRIFHDSNLIIYLKFFSFLIPIHIFTNIYFSIIRSHERIKANSFGINILENLFKFLFIILFVCIGIKTATAVSLSYILAISFGLIFAYVYCKFKLSYIFVEIFLSRKDKVSLRNKLISYSWPLILYAIIGTLMYYLDTFLIGYFKDAYWVGIYNAAIPIAMLLLLSSEIFMQMFLPMITKEMFSKNLIVVKELSKQVTKWICMINLPVTILIFLFPGIFINFLFGQEYLIGSNALRLLTIGQFIFSIAIIPNTLLLSKGKSKIILANLIFIGILNFILNFILIPKYGIAGAAFATSTSLIILSVLVIIENYHFNKIFPFRRKMLVIFLISLIPAGVLYGISKFINVNFILLVIFGILFAIIYFGLIILTKSFDKNDLMILKKIFRR